MAHSSRRRKKKNGCLPALLLVVLIAVGGWFGFHAWLDHGAKPFDITDKNTVAVEIPAGSGTTQIADLLKKAGVIDQTTVFRLKSRLDGNDGRYKAGQYQLSASMSMDAMMKVLLKGRSLTARVTIPEGYDIKKMTKLLADKGLIDPATFAAELERGQFDYPFLKDAPAGPNRLEGYLFPDTYEFFKTASEHDIINTMLKQFGKVFDERFTAQAKALKMNMNQIVTLASIIEREAVVQKDRPVIAGVFYNRLEKQMNLQSCATVQYILGEQKKRLTNADTRIQSPYNTYLHPGLPPGPICSPGKAALSAALWPEKNDYLYFLAKGDGSHVFAKTYEEHLANKKKYID